MRGAFGGLVAIILLGLYVYAVWTAVGGVEACISQQGCAVVPPGSFTDGMALAMSSIGGIVSALVIAQLAIAQPRQPVGNVLVNIVTVVYLLVWLAVGLWAFVVGVMQHPKVLQALTDLGHAWIGLAVSAVYAYLGIKPIGPGDQVLKQEPLGRHVAFRKQARGLGRLAPAGPE